MKEINTYWSGVEEGNMECYSYCLVLLLTLFYTLLLEVIDDAYFYIFFRFYRPNLFPQCCLGVGSFGPTIIHVSTLQLPNVIAASSVSSTLSKFMFLVKKCSYSVF